jgi:hypothetical protein
MPFPGLSDLELEPVEDIGSPLPVAGNAGSRLGETGSACAIEKPSEAAQRRERLGSSAFAV